MDKKPVSRRLFFTTALASLGIPALSHANPCYSCRGSGTGPFACTFCKGTGLNGNFKCSFCQGRRFPACAACRGTGRR